ncbi:AAA family ATPase [Thiothrix litoralis]|jgi:uncharacterized protein YhaN|uniref:AAA family ATPase n=1 Tax=Thiothrix litoralis TaxID=2891210 RepID=A0ABX7WY59_9GAMM|nr:YhaN family protein [Thiothrix litoralis]QTR47957.1 AAA family ATPase [Thiothrix litoralis]
MRIDRLDLRAYGAFTDKTLDLSAGAAGLHLIYGDNEAGKSTSLRAIIAWLFGIPARTSDDYLHPHTQMRVGGKLRLADGRSIEFVRRKGNKNTLLQPDTDAPLDDALLLPFLPASMNEDLFKKFHGIDHERLDAGGKALLSQAGDMGQVLFSATGIASSRLILERLESSAAELFKPTGNKPKVNQAIADFKKAQKLTKDLSLPVAEWKELNNKRDSIEASIQAIDAAIQQASKEKSRLDRLSRVKGALGQRREVMTHLQTLSEVLLLPEDFEAQYSTARDKLQTATEVKAKAAVKLASLQQEVDSLRVRHELLENEAEILAIHKELGAVDKTIVDKPRQDGQRRLLRNEADNLLKEIRPDLKLNDAAPLRPLLNNKKWLAELVKRHGILGQKREVADTSLREANDKQQQAQQILTQQPVLALDLSELKATLAVVSKAGNLEQRCVAAQKRAAHERLACGQALARLGRFMGELEALLTLALPVSATLDAFEKQFQANADELRDCSRQQKALEEEQQLAEQELAALVLSDVPTPAELDTARAARHHDWLLIKRHYLEPLSIVLDTALPARYEQKVDAADHVADRLRLGADQVVKRADLEARLQSLNARLAAIATASATAQVVKQALQQEWAAVWTPTGISSGTPTEMKQWVQKAEVLLSRLQSSNEQLAEAESLASEYASLKATLAKQIAIFAPSLDIQGLGLEAMLNVCEQRLGQEEAVLESHRQLRRDMEEAERRIQRVREELMVIGGEQAIWQGEWEQAIADLGLKADAHPEYVTAIFEQWVNFFAKFDKSEEANRRIYGMDKVLKDFESKVFAFADGMGFRREGHTASALADKLHQELNTAREARASLTKLKDSEKDIAEALQDATITIDAANQQLSELRAMASVASNADLASAGEASRHKRGLQQQLEVLEWQLSSNGDGLSLAALEQEAAASDIDALDAEIQRVATQLGELSKQRDALLAQRQTVHDAIQAKDGNAAAANAAEEAEQHLTSVVSGVEQYLRFACAALILKQRIEDYRKKNQTPVLLRAGELFAKLTLGAYASLRDELDDDGKPILLGVRPNNAEVWVERMSEGTRAQLYLSLRLATLEQQHSPHSEPMPFVVDDILIGFDDKRTRVGLEVLAEVAQQTQVLLFTHHRRVLDLAATLNAPAGVFTHELA